MGRQKVRQCIRHGVRQSLSRAHGNAVKPTLAVYYRTDSKVLCTSRKEITNNKNYGDIYKTVNTTNDFSVGTEICNLRQLYNTKQSLQKTDEHKLNLSAAGEHRKGTGETECIIGLMRAENSESSSFVHSLTILPDHYLAFAYCNTSLHNVECFCVNWKFCL